MNFLALNDDVKSIISNHLQSDCKINQIFMTEPDDNLQKILFGEVKNMTLDVEDICIDLSKNNKNIYVEIEFFQFNFIVNVFIIFNYNKIYVSKYFY